MVNKLYHIKIAYEDEKGYSSNFNSYDVLAETAEKAIKKIKSMIRKNEFVDEIEVLGVVEVE